MPLAAADARMYLAPDIRVAVVTRCLSAENNYSERPTVA